MSKENRRPGGGYQGGGGRVEFKHDECPLCGDEIDNRLAAHLEECNG